jgi:hypothetical protein
MKQFLLTSLACLTTACTSVQADVTASAVPDDGVLSVVVNEVPVGSNDWFITITWSQISVSGSRAVVIRGDSDDVIRTITANPFGNSIVLNIDDSDPNDGINDIAGIERIRILGSDPLNRLSTSRLIIGGDLGLPGGETDLIELTSMSGVIDIGGDVRSDVIVNTPGTVINVPPIRIRGNLAGGRFLLTDGGTFTGFTSDLDAFQPVGTRRGRS